MMKSIKFFLMAMMACVLTLGFTACSDDDDEPSSNYDVYQKTVNATVKSQKSHDKVILLVAFGSTWQQAYDAFDTTVAAYKQSFPDYDVFLSFSSAICINRAAAGENTTKRNFYAPPFWLTAFAQEGVQYKEIIVQSLQVIPGEEFSRVVNYIKDFYNNANGDLSDSYLASLSESEGVKMGYPLLYDATTDVDAAAKALDSYYKNYAAEGVMAFMGHGNPDSYDTYKANVRYTQLETALQKINPHYYVGTVDMMDNFKTDVLERMQADGFKSGKIACSPLMSIAGDHAHNDMAGDDDAWVEGVGFEQNEEGEVEDTSWKSYFGHMGYTYNTAETLIKGLLEIPAVRQLWMNHTASPVVMDYYNSKNPE